MGIAEPKERRSSVTRDKHQRSEKSGSRRLLTRLCCVILCIPIEKGLHNSKFLLWDFLDLWWWPLQAMAETILLLLINHFLWTAHFSRMREAATRLTANVARRKCDLLHFCQIFVDLKMFEIRVAAHVTCRNMTSNALHRTTKKFNCAQIEVLITRGRKEVRGLVIRFTYLES